MITPSNAASVMPVQPVNAWVKSCQTLATNRFIAHRLVSDPGADVRPIRCHVFYKENLGTTTSYYATLLT
ncbi:hypothetical protein GCM10009702_06580 [Propioniferax innocua]